MDINIETTFVKITQDECEGAFSASVCHLQLKVLKLCSYHIVCDCRNYSLHPGFFQPFLCNFSCSASCLLLNVGIDLSTLLSCFSHVLYFFFFIFQWLIVIAVTYFWNNTSNTAVRGFYFVLIKLFILCERDSLIIKIQP